MRESVRFYVSLVLSNQCGESHKARLKDAPIVLWSGELKTKGGECLKCVAVKKIGCSVYAVPASSLAAQCK